MNSGQEINLKQQVFSSNLAAVLNDPSKDRNKKNIYLPRLGALSLLNQSKMTLVKQLKQIID